MRVFFKTVSDWVLADEAERALRVKVVAGDLGGVTVGDVGQGAAGADPWAVEFLVPQHVIVDSMPAAGSGLTDAELRATPVAVSGPITNAQAIALGLATDAGLAAIYTRLADGSVRVGGTVAVSGTFWQATQPISATSLPLPTGASTGAKQDTGNASLASIDGKLANPLPVTGPLTNAQLTAAALATEATLALIKAKTDNLDVALSTRAVTGLTDAEMRASPVPVDGSAVTQPISITVENPEDGNDLDPTLLLRDVRREAQGARRLLETLVLVQSETNDLLRQILAK